jgi:hypothetical protein
MYVGGRTLLYNMRRPYIDPLDYYKALSIKIRDKLAESDCEDFKLSLEKSTPNKLDEFSIE